MTMSNWQPIETAPKDGTRMVLFCERVVSRIHTGHWFSHEKQTDGVTSWRYSGWWLDGFQHPFNQPPFEPTHWMPLPDPPQRRGEG